ncbi:MAG: hypothetical protein ACLTDX_13945 [[Clostridium] innocuum]
MKNPNLAAIYDDRSFAGHPGGLGILAAGNFFNSFAWGGVYAILIYYLHSRIRGAWDLHRDRLPV